MTDRPTDGQSGLYKSSASSKASLSLNHKIDIFDKSTYLKSVSKEHSYTSCLPGCAWATDSHVNARDRVHPWQDWTCPYLFALLNWQAMLVQKDCLMQYNNVINHHDTIIMSVALRFSRMCQFITKRIYVFSTHICLISVKWLPICQIRYHFWNTQLQKLTLDNINNGILNCSNNTQELTIRLPAPRKLLRLISENKHMIDWSLSRKS